MKKNNKIINFMLIVFVSVSFLLVSSCSKELDNRKYPQSRISGKFLYNGQPMQIMGTSSDVVGTNMLQLTQTGPGTYTSGYIKMFTKGDGTYTILTFDGDYSLAVTPGKGPWQPVASPIEINLKGEAKDVDFNVTPYFWISNYKATYQDSVFTAAFNLEKVVPSANLEKVVIYFGTTNIVDITSKFVERAYTNIVPGAVTLSFDLKTLTKAEKAILSTTGFTFARIGIKTRGVSDLLYSTTSQLK